MALPRRAVRLPGRRLSLRRLGRRSRSSASRSSSASGTIPTVVLIIACGALGMLAADGIETAFASAATTSCFAAGGNGIALGLLAAWAVMRAAEVRARPERGRGGDRRRRRCRRPDPAAPGRRLRQRLRRTRRGAWSAPPADWPPSFARRERHPGWLDAWPTTSSSRSHPSSTATRWSTARSATAWCPRSSRPGEEMGDLAVDADRRRPGRVHDHPGARRSAPGGRSRSGTFLGYGAIAIARGLPDDGELVCCELDEEYAERAREHLRRAGLDEKVEFRVGPALESLRAMEPHRAVRLRLHRRRQDRVHRLLRGDPARGCARTG